MKDKHNFPLVNERITEAMKKLGKGKITSSLNKFRYRYRIARAFESINAPDIDVRTSNGYAVGIKLFLAYGAFNEIIAVRNLLPKVREEHGRLIKHNDKKLAEKIRENKELGELLKTSSAVNDKNLKIDIADFYVGTNDDIMCIATAVRNTFAHGIYTAAGAGLKTKKRQKEFNEITNVLLAVTDEIASACVNEILSKEMK
jgi:hypothetical protein